LGLVFVLLGCGGKEEVVSGLERTELVNVLSTLESAAIPYEKRSTGTGRAESYSVWVDSHDFMPALNTLKNNGLLAESSSEFEQLTKQQGFVPQTRRIEQLREDRILSLDLERLIRNLSGVLEVRVAVRTIVPADGSTSPARNATIVIRYSSKSGVQPFSNEELTRLATTVVPGLQEDRITVSISRVSAGEENKPKSVKIVPDVSSSFQAKLWLVVVAALVLVLMIGLMFGFMLRDKLIAWKIIPRDSSNPLLKTEVNATLSRLPRIKP
jgi:type III secretory pathway lipoprotein EscJ